MWFPICFYRVTWSAKLAKTLLRVRGGKIYVNLRKNKWIKKAKEQERPSLEDLSDCQRKKFIDATLHRIDLEVLYS